MSPTLCGVILHPAGHTLSPLLHTAAYRQLGLDAEFAVWDVPAEGLADAIERMRTQGVRQLSVSLPHKEAVLELADRVGEHAGRIGAANTLTRVGDEVVAENTDWLGVQRALEPHGPWQGRAATVLGAGGAARAIVYALGRLGVEVVVSNRTQARAEQLAAALGARVSQGDEPWDLLVNATSVGMEPHSGETPYPAERLRPGATVFDSVYRPLETRLLREASGRGCVTQDGLDMLIHQAIEQLRLWSGKAPEPASLRRVALEALGSR